MKRAVLPGGKARPTRWKTVFDTVRAAAARRTLAVALAMNCAFTATGAVFQSSVGVSPITGYPNANYAIGASTQPNNQGLGAGLLLFVDTHLVLRPVTGTAGIGHVWYRTFDGIAIDPAFVGSATPFAQLLGTGDFSGQIQMTLGGSFLMAFYLEASGDNSPGPGDCFGWARLSYTSANGLTLLGNAIEDSGAGIIAGTTNVVPEPGSLALLFGGLFAVLGQQRFLRVRH